MNFCYIRHRLMNCSCYNLNCLMNCSCCSFLMNFCCMTSPCCLMNCFCCILMNRHRMRQVFYMSVKIRFCLWMSRFCLWSRPCGLCGFLRISSLALFLLRKSCLCLCARMNRMVLQRPRHMYGLFPCALLDRSICSCCRFLRDVTVL